MAQLTRLNRLITICQRAAKAIPLISDTDRAETFGTDRADCDGTRFAGPPFWRDPPCGLTATVLLTPVALPPGRARLATRPRWTGSFSE